MDFPTLIHKRYQVIDRVGSGSLSTVYRAYDLKDENRLVALKILYPDISKDKVCLERLRKDFDALNSLNHKNVVTVIEYFEGEHPGYSMELIVGGNLAEIYLDPFRSISIKNFVTLLIQICEGLHEIHSKGLIHRNVKPENILVSSNDEVKIADLCCSSKLSTQKDSVAVATLDYVAPEYLINSEVTLRTDIYALGMLSYELLTGRHPYSQSSVYKTMTQCLKSDPKPLTEFREDIPEALSTLILKTLNRDPEKRQQSANECKSELLSLGAYLR